ncbi:hypothetical protein BCR34DRAFT_595300 [Clohesyomyces aquaticus]|uniref:SWR1-complex protein 3 domain-containing protein n=1 Tax=Clohesyomyces aquaticus TaxID=1231657 RepID=A0A1Y2ACY4_9PLEO|nr:hypothetical protein BCR34DRAFT_595300 [Clohesyomyces aquaticus]
MAEPRRSTRARAREEAAPPQPPEPPKETLVKTPAKQSSKRKRTSVVVKDSTPATPVSETPLQPPKQVLPIKLVDGQPLPTLPEPQPMDLSPEEYQSIQQSGVLGASLQRSRAVWISGANFRLFHALFTGPKKVADRTEEDKQKLQRQKEIVKNFPQLGSSAEAKLVVEPHTFPIRIYGPRETIRAAQKKPPTYGHWPNHNQYPPYQQYKASTPTYAPKPVPQPRPAQPKPPPPIPKPTPPAASSGSTTPAPDPVIHMLAQRAGTDPELKAVMKIVAAGQATKEQLEFFQGHINELTQILQRQKEAAARTAPPPPPPVVKTPTPVPQPQPQFQAPPPRQAPQPPSQPPPQPAPHHTPQPGPHATPQPTQRPAPYHTPQPASHPPPRPNQQHAPHPYQHQQGVPRPFPPGPTPVPHTQAAPAPPRPPPYSNPYSHPQQHSGSYTQMNQPQIPTYRPLIFDFVEGNGDKFYFPSYSIMEWLPNNQGAKFSFLITKMKPKPKEEVLKAITPSTFAPKAAPTPSHGQVSNATPNPQGTMSINPSTPDQVPTQNASATATPGIPSPAPAVTQYVPPPRVEDFDEKRDIKDIELYQPVTIIIQTNNYEILQSLPRAVRPPHVVEKYMDEVFDTCKRAEETYLAFRLPIEGAADGEGEKSEAVPVMSTPSADVIMTGMGSVEKRKGAGRPRRSLVDVN